MKNQWSGGWILVAAVVGFVLGLLPAILVQALVQDYQWARVVAAALSVAIAAAAALAGVLQYFRNSRNSRIERSMEFWKRSNCGDVKDHLEDFINYWAELRAGKQKLDFEALARTDDHTLEESKRKRKHHIECLLDFYDEACGAVKLGACDRLAMYFYLGPLMIRHRNRLATFIEIWREKHNRPEKWDCFTRVVDEWRVDLNLERQADQILD